ncbi:MAG: hypothetical protein AAB879_03500 [Patescibacteria group bacterium]
MNHARLFLRTWKTTLSVTGIGVGLSLIFSIAQPLRYSSTERLLITHTNVVGIDPYTAIKSTERIGQNLRELIYTTSFFNAVMSKAKIDATYFPTDEISRRGAWKNTIDGSVIAGTGIMSITAYHTNRANATELAVRVAQELVAITPNYFGYSVRVQIIDDPLPSRFFAKPDFAKNGIFGAIAGFLIGTIWVLGKGSRQFGD